MSSNSIRFLAAAGVLSLAGATAGSAAVVYEAGVVLTDVVSGSFADDDFPQFLAQQITFDTDVTIAGMDWSGAYGSSGTPTGLNDFRFSLYTDSGGLPDLTALAERTITLTDTADSGEDFSNFDIYSYSGDITDIFVVAGSYWVSITNDTSDDGDDDWAWMRGASSDTAAFRTDDNGPWTQDTDRNYDLTLFDENTDQTAPIPLPSGLPALAAALGLLGWMRRRAA